MEDLKIVVASNLINLRKAAKLTQAELGEKIGYSDKSISKWERADALPDVYVLKTMADLYGVTVDHILTEHGEWKPEPKKTFLSDVDAKNITEISLLGIFALALLIFVVFWILDQFVWITFIYALPVALITLLVLHSVWQEGKYNYLIIALLVFSIAIAFYFSFYYFAGKNYWQIMLLLIPGELIVYLTSRFGKKPVKPHE